MLGLYRTSHMRLAEDLRFKCTLRQKPLACQLAASGGLPDEELKLKLAGARNSTKARTFRGFTLVEIVVALAIITLLFSGILTAYVQSSRSAEWAGYSLAAQAISIQQIEQARSGVWDYSINKNELTNLNLLAWSYNATTRVGIGYTTNVLDLPVSGTNIVVVTNFVTVKTLNLTGFTNVQVQMVAVDTVWPFFTRSGTRLFTNRTASYFGPDNRDMSSL
jgi:prepilin-type N-terminal cleavage/methylation domain-containing protein